MCVVQRVVNQTELKNGFLPQRKLISDYLISIESLQAFCSQFKVSNEAFTVQSWLLCHKIILPKCHLLMALLPSLFK